MVLKGNREGIERRAEPGVPCAQRQGSENEVCEGSLMLPRHLGVACYIARYFDPAHTQEDW